MPPDEPKPSNPAGAIVDGLTLGDVLPLRKMLGNKEPTTTAIGIDGPTLRIVAHALPCEPSLHCISLITDGLSRLGRDEMILTVPEAVVSQAPNVPAQILTRIVAGLEAAPRLGPGAFIGARHPEWPQLTGFALERTWPMNDVELPPGCVSLHALVGTELEAVGDFGPLRVLARLGNRAHFWPTPTWCDPHRTPVADPTEQTFLRRVNSGHFPGITVTLEKPAIVLRVSRSALPQLSDLDQVDPRLPFALFTSLHPHADGLLSWTPGEPAATANARGDCIPSRLAGCFFAVLPGKSTNVGGALEDGFTMSLTQQNADAFRRALLAGQPMNIRAGRGLDLRVEWTGELP